MPYKVPYYFVEVVWSMALITHCLPPLLRPGGAQAARVLHPRYMDTRCSEQNRRKTVTQSFRGLPRPKVATSARPPATRDFPRAAGDFFVGARTTHVGRIPVPSPGGEKGKPGESRGRKAPRLPHALRATPVELPNLTQERICLVAPGVGQWPSRGSGCSRRANAHSVPLSRRRATQSCKSSRRPRASRSILTRHNSFSRTVARRPATASPSS